MRAVDSAPFAPGQAIGNGPSADLVDTGFDDIAGGRIYLSRDQVLQAWAALGHPSIQAFGGLVEERDRMERELAGLEAENRVLKAALEEADSLRRAVAYTLERGVVTDPKKLTVGLRHVPGQKRVDLSASLWPAPPED